MLVGFAFRHRRHPGPDPLPRDVNLCNIFPNILPHLDYICLEYSVLLFNKLIFSRFTFVLLDEGMCRTCAQTIKKSVWSILEFHNWISGKIESTPYEAASKLKKFLTLLGFTLVCRQISCGQNEHPHPNQVCSN